MRRVGHFESTFAGPGDVSVNGGRVRIAVAGSCENGVTPTAIVVDVDEADRMAHDIMKAVLQLRGER